MKKLEIYPYEITDNSDALNLERFCPQGKGLSLKFVRPTFHARSEVYQDYRILTAKIENKLIGIAAGANKQIKAGDKLIQAIYGYDLRVHPDYRKYGTAKILTEAVIKEFGNDIDCAYTLIAGENERALSFIKRSFGAKIVIPLTYFIFPVFKMTNEIIKPELSSVTEVHTNYLRFNPALDFTSEFDEKYLLGHVNSISFGEKAGCSIWTNENLLSEQVVKLTPRYNILRFVFNTFKLFIPFPIIPKQGEIIESWFIYDLYAEDIESLSKLLISVNNLAFSKGKKFLYILLQNGDQLISLIQKVKKLIFEISYFFLAKGKIYPNDSSRIYLDIRDL